MARANREIVLLSGNTHPDLCEAICGRLGLRRAEITVYHAANRETLITIPETVRAKDVFIVQTATFENVNDAIMELLLMCYTCRTSAAHKIVGVLPYLPYCKQTKPNKRGAIPSKLLARLISKAGFDQILTVDLRHREVQGFFDIPVDNLRASPFLIRHIRQQMEASGVGRDQVVIVARQSSSVRKATAYSQRLKVDLAILNGSQYDPEAQIADGRSSPPPVQSIELVPGGDCLPVFTDSSNFRAPIHLVGEVRGKLAILLDDIVDNVDHFIQAARYLKEQGATQVHLVATHALFSPAAAERLEASEVDHIVVTNTVPHEEQKGRCAKIATIDVGVLLTEAIRRIYNNESLAYLFAEVSVAD